jgi:tRNA threonylcarbamoyladenosine biosynthesis protein TsaB
LIEWKSCVKVLAMDTAAVACSVAAWEDGEVLAWQQKTMARGHAEALLPMVQAVLRDAAQPIDAFDVIAVTVGPGAFTGIRIGLAAARGIALAAGLPCIGVTTLEAIAMGTLMEEHLAVESLLVAIDTKRDDIYAQVFDPDGGMRGTAMACSYEALADQMGAGPTLVAGDAAGKVVSYLCKQGVEVISSHVSGAVDPRAVAAIAARRMLTQTGLFPPEPLYLRLPRTTLPRA